MKGVSITNYINDDPKDGIEGLCIFGVPKAGKSNMAHSIMYMCLIQNNENIVMPGDMFCEFRNLVENKECYNELIVLVPKDFDIHYHNVPDDIHSKIREVDYNKLNVEEYLRNKERTILIIYDALFYKELLWRRVKLWNDIATQLLFRTYSLDKPIVLLFHEAGVFFPQISLKEHWKQTYDFNQLNVDFRKGLIRLILISQLDKEILNTVRNKQYWVIYKKGKYSDTVPKPIRDKTPFYSVAQYCIAYGGIYTPNNTITKLNESKDVWKMIPDQDSMEYSLENGLIEVKKRDKNIKQIIAVRLSEEGMIQARIAELLDVSQQSVSRYLNTPII